MTVELLAPVRDEVSFAAAISAGADAVYFGLGHLNMRLNSKGIEVEQLANIVSKAHQQNKKAYVTLNAIIYDEEMDLLDEMLEQITTANVDAVICSDLAVIEKASALNIPVHISTQANISNAAAANFYKKLGAERIVLARELSLEQIKVIKRQADLEIEVFAHGAMCVSVSGRCFMSQFTSGHSANRGDCLQPCRREYRIIDQQTNDELEVSNGYVLSPKDLCTLPILDQLIDAGIDVLKIEGRSRAPEYIKTVVGAYRRAIDAAIAGTFDQQLVEALMQEVGRVYNRGFSTGFLLNRPGPQDWSDRPGSQATEKKAFVGKVLNYYPKTKVAFVRVQDHSLNIGDTIQVHGETTGVEEFQITELRNNEGGVIKSIEKDDATFPVPIPIRRNDKIYKITTRTPLEVLGPGDS